MELRQLEGYLGRSAAADLDDGHARWDLYRVALDSVGALPLLLGAISAEPDSSVASGVVGEVLERVPAADRQEWVHALVPSVRGFSERRSRELGVLESIRGGDLSAARVADLIDDWTDWLQLRVIGAVRDPDVLRLLAERGRTKRIRHTAREALS